MEHIKKRAPIRRSKAERDELVAKWRASGQTPSRFAAEHGLASSSLHQWIAAGRGRGTKRKGRKPGRTAKAAFTEVSAVGQIAARGSAMTVALRGGHSVTFEGGAVDPVWLESVLRVVSAC